MTQARAKRGQTKSAAAPERGRGPAENATGGRAGANYSAGPMVGLGSPVQTKVKVGESGDSYEREADAVASTVASGGSLGSMAGATLGGGNVRRADAPSPAPEDKKPDESVQRVEATKTTEEKKPEATLQKAEATRAPEEKKPEATVRKADLEKQPVSAPEEQATAQEDEVMRAEERAGEGGGAGAQAVEAAAPATTPQQAEQGKQQGAPALSMDEIAQQAVASSGPGRAMNPQTRQTLEQRMGADLRDVRVHDDPAARQATKSLNARAFTHGRDIWLGEGQTDADLELMAHEATHVLQQGAGTHVHRQSVQRSPLGATLAAPSGLVMRESAEEPDDGADAIQRSLLDGNAAMPSAQAPNGGAVPPVQRAVVTQGATKGKRGSFDHATKTLKVYALTMPAFKVPQLKTPITVKAGEGLDRTQETKQQVTEWRKKVKQTITPQKVSDALVAKHPNLTGLLPLSAAADKSEGKPGLDNRSYFFEIGSSGRYLAITKQTVVESFVIPTWSRGGGAGARQRLFDVDHKIDYQLGGSTTDTTNLWLVDAAVNRGMGRKVAGYAGQAIQEAIQDAHADVANRANGPWKTNAPKVAWVRKQYDVVFENLIAGAPTTGEVWKQDEVENVDTIADLKPVSSTDAVTKNLLGQPASLVVYMVPGGSKPRKFQIQGTGYKLNEKAPGSRILGILVDPIAYTPGKPGKLEGVGYRVSSQDGITPRQRAFRGDKAWDLIELADYTVAVDPASLRYSMKYAELQGMSPVEFDEVYLDEERGIQARGKVLPTLAIFKEGVTINIVVDGDDFGLAATFTKDDLKLPGPIKVNDASITLGLYTGKLSVEGDLSLEIPNAAKGDFKAFANTKGQWGLKGKVEFDTKLFNPADIEVSYENDKLSGKGRLGIEKGKIRGIESAMITASIADGVIEATGNVKPSIPGVEQASLTVKYGEKEGLLIGGELQLKKDIPGIEGGSVKVEVVKLAGEERYRVKAQGEAKPKIPGVNSTLKVLYDDGAFDASVMASYEKGMLKGSLMVGATNRPVDANGQPVPGPAEDKAKIVVYGGGSLTLRLTPWLQGTAAVSFKPNGEIEVKGEIALPAALDLLPEKSFTKNLFKIGIDIPIVGVSVAGQRIGIFANITGGADLSAGIGPVQLNGMSLAVTYNPDHEDQTLVSGKANLHVGAHAGIRLFVRGGIGVGIPIVSAQAGLEIGAELGLVGALDAGVQVDWSAAKGLVIDAKGSLFVEPKLKVDLTGFVLVEADLLVTTVTLYEQKWKLGGFEVGSGLRLGVTFPIHYEEGKPFDISLSDLQFQVPDINPREVLENIIKQIA